MSDLKTLELSCSECGGTGQIRPVDLKTGYPLPEVECPACKGLARWTVRGDALAIGPEEECPFCGHRKEVFRLT